MARTVEVVTAKSLTDILSGSVIHFQKAGKSRRIAESVKDNAEAFETLSESATMHEEAGLKDIRKVQVKLVNAFGEAAFVNGQLEKLVALALEFKLIESGDVVVLQPAEGKKE